MVTPPEGPSASDVARLRAGLVRTVAQTLSTEMAVDEIWERCAVPIALLVGASRLTVALRGRAGDLIVYVARQERGEPVPVPPGSVAADVLAAGESVRREATLGVPIRWGRVLLGAMVLEGLGADADDGIPLVEACALYVGARLQHGDAVEASEYYARLAMSDALTGIANRRRFDIALGREWSRGVRERFPVALLYLDLDNFKAYNDRLGHQAGDACLRRVAGAVAGCFRRPADLVARYGGEEFVALLPNTDLNGAIALAEECRIAVLQLALPHPGTSLGRVSVSVGVAALVPDAETARDQLVAAADAALYAAKQGGRDRVVAAGYVSAEAATVTLIPSDEES